MSTKYVLLFKFQEWLEDSKNSTKENNHMVITTDADVAKNQESLNVTYDCYGNFTIYYPLYESAKFWIEGVLLIGVGLLGLCGNFLTLAVLGNSKRSTFNQLLIVLSICDSLLIVFFIMMSACTTGRSIIQINFQRNYFIIVNTIFFTIFSQISSTFAHFFLQKGANISK